MTFGRRRRDRFGRAVAQRFHRIEITGQHRLGPYLVPGLIQRNHRVDIDHLAAQTADAWQNAADVAADVQPHPRPHRVQAIDQSLLVGANELFINLRADQRRGGVAHADQIDARLDLRGQTQSPSPR